MELDFKYNGNIIRLIKNQFRDSLMFVVIKDTASVTDPTVKRYILAKTKWVQIAEGSEFPVYYSVTASTKFTLSLLIDKLNQIREEIDQCPFPL